MLHVCVCVCVRACLLRGLAQVLTTLTTLQGATHSSWVRNALAIQRVHLLLACHASQTHAGVRSGVGSSLRLRLRLRLCETTGKTLTFVHCFSWHGLFGLFGLFDGTEGTEGTEAPAPPKADY